MLPQLLFGGVACVSLCSCDIIDRIGSIDPITYIHVAINYMYGRTLISDSRGYPLVEYMYAEVVPTDADPRNGWTEATGTTPTWIDHGRWLEILLITSCSPSCC